MALSSSQTRALAIIAKPFALLSMIGSALVFREIVTDSNKRQLTYHRILAVMSCIDFFTSLWFFVGTWAVPAGTAGVWAAAGTEGSCTAQGFFISLNIASPLYNISLAVYYLLVVRGVWDEDQIKKRASSWLLLPPLLFGLAVAFAGLGLDLYAPANLWCWIDASYSQYRWGFFYGPLWFSIFAATYVMAFVYAITVKMLNEESENDEEATSLQQLSNIFWFLRKESTEASASATVRKRRMARQGFWYFLAFALTWTFPTCVRAIQMNGRSPAFGLLVMWAIFAPLQGMILAFCIIGTASCCFDFYNIILSNLLLFYGSPSQVFSTLLYFSVPGTCEISRSILIGLFSRRSGTKTMKMRGWGHGR